MDPRLQATQVSGFPGGSVIKNLPVNAGNIGDPALIPGSGRFPGERNGNPPQYSCLGIPTKRGAWQAIAMGWNKSRTQFSN